MAPNPHHALFTRTFLKRDNAISFLRAMLPQGLVRQLDFSTLTSLPTHFVDAKFEECESDLLFSIQLAQHPAFILTLFEHQSTLNWWMVLRLLEYVWINLEI